MVLFLSLELDCRIGQRKGSILTRWSHSNPATMGTHEYHFLGLKERLPVPVPVELVIFAWFLWCVRYFFPTLEPWVSPVTSQGPVRHCMELQSALGSVPAPWCLFDGEVMRPWCPWGREHDDQLWVLHFRQNLIYIFYIIYIWWLIYNILNIN